MKNVDKKLNLFGTYRIVRVILIIDIQVNCARFLVPFFLLLLLLGGRGRLFRLLWFWFFSGWSGSKRWWWFSPCTKLKLLIYIFKCHYSFSFEWTRRCSLSISSHPSSFIWCPTLSFCNRTKRLFGISRRMSSLRRMSSFFMSIKLCL